MKVSGSQAGARSYPLREAWYLHPKRSLSRPGVLRLRLALVASERVSVCCGIVQGPTVVCV